MKTKGVKTAAVSFEKQQATVTYDPKATNPTQLIEVVRKTPSMMGPTSHYDAKVKGK